MALSVDKDLEESVSEAILDSLEKASAWGLIKPAENNEWGFLGESNENSFLITWRE